LNWFRQEAVKRQRLPESILQDDDLVLVERLRLNEGSYLSRAATLLFHPEPQRFFNGAFIKIGYFSGESDLKFHDLIEGDLFTQLDKTMDLLLSKYTHASIRFTGKQREETLPLPETALREAIVNAIAHKDYSSGNPIQIRVHDDRIMIWNDGQLPENWTVRNLLQKHASIPYNPDIARVFFHGGKIEAWGSGIDRMIEACANHGNPKPIFQYERIGLMLTLPFLDTSLTSTTRKATEKATEKVTEKKIGATGRSIIEAMEENPYITIAELAKHLNRSTSAIEKQLAKLQAMGRVQRIGSDKGGHWETVYQSET